MYLYNIRDDRSPLITTTHNKTGWQHRNPSPTSGLLAASSLVVSSIKAFLAFFLSSLLFINFASPCKIKEIKHDVGKFIKCSFVSKVCDDYRKKTTIIFSVLTEQSNQRNVHISIQDSKHTTYIKVWNMDIGYCMVWISDIDGNFRTRSNMSLEVSQITWCNFT